MRRKLSILCLISILFVLVTGFSSSQDKVYDDAGLLTDSEASTLQDLLVDNAKQIKCDLIVVTTNNVQNKSSMSYAEDFFMAHDFGYDKKHGDAVLLLINMDDREIWISTSGDAKYVMTDSRISKVLDDVADYLGSGKYYNGCKTFANGVKKYYQSSSGTDNNYHSDDVSFVPDGIAEVFEGFTAEDILIRMGISLLIAIIIVLVMRSGSKAKMTVDSHTYSKNDGCRVTGRSDVFIRTTVTKTPKNQNNGSGGGGSSIHIGSGGHSFGGGGRKF